MKTNLSKEVAATSSKKKRFDKKKVNLRVNPLINFQIGLIAALLFAYLVIELTSKQVELKHSPYTLQIEEPSDWNHKEFTMIPNNPLPEVAVAVPNKELPPVIVDNKTPEPEVDPILEPKPIVQPVISTQLTISSDTGPVTTTSNNGVNSAPAAPITTTMDGVDSMPLFPGCEFLENNEERRKCFNDKIHQFVQRKFDKDLANGLDLKSGEIVKIDILFTINELGLPVDVKVKTPHGILEKEAYRLVGKLPRITPGKVKGNPVSVYFHLPIRFKMQR